MVISSIAIDQLHFWSPLSYILESCDCRSCFVSLPRFPKALPSPEVGSWVWFAAAAFFSFSACARLQPDSPTPPHGTSHPPPTPLLPDPNARCRRGTTSSARRRSSGKQTQFSDKRDKRGCETAMVAGKLRRGKKDGEESKYKGRWWGSLGCLNPPRSRVLPPLC